MSAAPNWDHFFEDDFPLLLLLILSSVVAAAVNLPNKCLLIRATGFLFVFQRFRLDSTQTVLKKTAKEISVLFIPLVFLLPFSSAVLSFSSISWNLHLVFGLIAFLNLCVQDMLNKVTVAVTEMKQKAISGVHVSARSSPAN